MDRMKAHGAAAAVLAIGPMPARDPLAAWIALCVLLLAAAILGLYTLRLARKNPRRPRS
jgi:hypothetical protein